MLTTSNQVFPYIFVLLDAFILLELCKQNLFCILQLITMPVLLFWKCVVDVFCRNIHDLAL